MNSPHSVPQLPSADNVRMERQPASRHSLVTGRMLAETAFLTWPRLFSMPHLRSLVCLASAVAVALSGCRHKPPVATDASPPTVTVSQPVQREVTDYADFVGRTEAPLSLDVRARVTGYLTKMPFIEGTTVKAGDLLCEIDDRPYQDDLDQAQASLEQAKAALVKAQGLLDIGLETQKANVGAISVQEIVLRRGGRDEAAAAVRSAQATLEKCQLDYDWCKITSPMDGRVSRYYITVGNLVNQDTTLLTTVVSEDPMYAYFDVDERTILRILRHLLPSEIDLMKSKQVPVLMGLVDEEGFPHTGYIDFADNVVNAGTGTVMARGVFANPRTPSGRPLLKPGMFVRIRLPIGKPHQALLVSEKALGTDQGQKYVFVVDAQHLVQYRRVKVGAVQPDGLRVIEEGLQSDDWVLVSGLQLVRPRIAVTPQRASMPGNGGGPAAAATQEEGRQKSAVGTSGEKRAAPPPPSRPKSATPSPAEQPAADRRAAVNASLHS